MTRTAWTPSVRTFFEIDRFILNSILIICLVYFTATLEPNGPFNRDFQWPLYQPQNRALMTFTDADPPFNITLDTYRDAPMNLLNDIELGQIGHGV